MGIKRLVGIAAAIAIGLGVIFFLRQGGRTDKTLRFLTWSNYYPEAVLAEFTKQTGIRVELSYMSSNEELFAKLRAGATGFDLIQPSDYMVKRMAQLSMLAPLDHAKLPNLKHIDEYYLNPTYDPALKHSVPFTWGTTGISVNTKRVTIPPEGVTWKLIYESPDPRHTSLLDDMREAFAGVLKLHGLSINTTDLAALEKTQKEIAKAKENILTFSSEPKPLLLKGEITIAHIFSVDGAQVQHDNPEIKYFIPKEGGTIWTDNFSIPSSSKNANEAHLFIDYFLEPANALKLIRENQLATPNKTARLQLSEEEKGNPNIYPPKEVLDRLQFLEDAGDSLQTLNRLWTELKS